MDADFQIRKFSELIGVTQNMVISWELRGMTPLRKVVTNRIQGYIAGIVTKIHNRYKSGCSNISAGVFWELNANLPFCMTFNFMMHRLYMCQDNLYLIRIT
jgi:hypothetical protein